MNKVTIEILFVVIAMAACQQTKDSTIEDVNDTISEKQSEKKAEVGQGMSTEKPKDWKEFKTVFAFSDNDVTQTLGITTLTNDVIEFRLLTENNLCDTQYWGRARNFYPGGDPEIDEDENMEAYEASEFILEDSFKIIKIRIADTNDKAKIKVTDKTETETDCFPTPGLLLKKAENVR